MSNITVTLITNLFRLYIMKRFMYIFFNPKDVNKTLEFSAYLFFYLFTTSIYCIFHYPLATFLSNIIGLYIITLIYTSSQKSKFLIISIVYIINMVCDMISTFLLSDYIYGKKQNINTAFITLMLFSICGILAEKIIKKQEYNFFEMKHWKTLIIIPLYSILILFVLLTSEDNNKSMTIVMSIGILIINMIVIYLYNALITSYLLLKENTVFKQQTEIYSKQLDILMQSNNRIRSIQHDMKNHLIQLGIIAKKDHANNILDYISNISDFVSNPEEHVHCGNKDIDGILNYMIHKALNKSIEVEIKVNIPENIVIKAFDLNVILGNLLDNAIEALEKEKNKFLNITLSYVKGILYINIINSYTEHIKEKNNKLLTTKKDKENHGIGLANVRRVVQSYNGTVDIIRINNQFKVQAILYVPKQ